MNDRLSEFTESILRLRSKELIPYQGVMAEDAPMLRELKERVAAFRHAYIHAQGDEYKQIAKEVEGRLLTAQTTFNLSDSEARDLIDELHYLVERKSGKE